MAMLASKSIQVYQALSAARIGKKLLHGQTNCLLGSLNYIFVSLWATGAEEPTGPRLSQK